ncbi:hypothetical protein VHUM_02078 [Vanrija humicola]|uniref:Beta-lactamase-related domain-containing protein n=1 Tax=Vanrija humicola TaxID=5417 RepID=A0A7D8V1U0_VANHU|nr:hypothetical protein VHUM_02078 [Vanrija humicola]
MPAFAFGAATADEVLYFNAEGPRVYGEPDKGQVDDKTLYQMYSMTKLVTAVAALQLVDEGKLQVDDPAIIEETLPELCAQPILSYDADGKEVLTARKNPITLRRLLSHTSGLGYPTLDPRLARWLKENDPPVFFNPDSGLKALEVPLLFEPGTSFVYGIGIDWAGVLVERLSGKTLEEYFQERIFRPLGITSITFILTQDIIDRLQHVTDRDDEGKLHLAPSLRELTPHTMEQFHGGDGLYGNAKDYLRFLQAVLASQKPGGIISPESYKWLFEDALPERGGDNTAHQVLHQFLHILPVDHTLLADGGKALGFSLSLQLNSVDSALGRKAGSASWGGAAKTLYWLDPVTNLVGICFTQVLAGNPLQGSEYVNDVYYKFERKLYDVLE